MSNTFNPEIIVHNGEGLTLTARPSQSIFAGTNGDVDLELKFKDGDIDGNNEVSYKNAEIGRNEISDDVFMRQKIPTIVYPLDGGDSWFGDIEIKIDIEDEVKKGLVIDAEIYSDSGLKNLLTITSIDIDTLKGVSNRDSIGYGREVFIRLKMVLPNGIVNYSQSIRVITDVHIIIRDKQHLIDCFNDINLEVKNFDTSRITDLSYFWCQIKIRRRDSMDMRYWDVSNVTDFSYCFGYPDDGYVGENHLDMINVNDYYTLQFIPGHVIDVPPSLAFPIEPAQKSGSMLNFGNKKVRDCMQYGGFCFLGWDMSSAKSMKGMFRRCVGLSFGSYYDEETMEQVYPLLTINYNNVEDMSHCFEGTLYPMNFDHTGLSKVKDMSYIFKDSFGFNANYDLTWNHSWENTYTPSGRNVEGENTNSVVSRNGVCYAPLHYSDLRSLEKIEGMFERCEVVFNLLNKNMPLIDDLRPAYKTAGYTYENSMVASLPLLYDIGLDKCNNGNLKTMKDLFKPNFGSKPSLDRDFFIYSCNYNSGRTCKNINFTYRSLDYRISVNTVNVTDMSSSFMCCQFIDLFNFSNFDFSSVENVSRMFAFVTGLGTYSTGYCEFKTSNLTGLNFPVATDFSYMFAFSTFFNDTGLTQDATFNSWTTLSDINLEGFFFNCNTFTSRQRYYIIYRFDKLKTTTQKLDWTNASISFFGMNDAPCFMTNMIYDLDIFYNTTLTWLLANLETDVFVFPDPLKMLKHLDLETQLDDSTPDNRVSMDSKLLRLKYGILSFGQEINSNAYPYFVDKSILATTYSNFLTNSLKGYYAGLPAKILIGIDADSYLLKPQPTVEDRSYMFMFNKTSSYSNYTPFDFLVRHTVIENNSSKNFNFEGFCIGRYYSNVWNEFKLFETSTQGYSFNGTINLNFFLHDAVLANGYTYTLNDKVISRVKTCKGFLSNIEILVETTIDLSKLFNAGICESIDYAFSNISDATNYSVGYDNLKADTSYWRFNSLVSARWAFYKYKHCYISDGTPRGIRLDKLYNMDWSSLSDALGMFCDSISEGSATVSMANMRLGKLKDASYMFYKCDLYDGSGGLPLVTWQNVSVPGSCKLDNFVDISNTPFRRSNFSQDLLMKLDSIGIILKS